MKKYVFYVLQLLLAAIVYFTSCTPREPGISVHGAGDSVRNITNVISFYIHYLPSGETIALGETLNSGRSVASARHLTQPLNIWTGEAAMNRGLLESVMKASWQEPVHGNSARPTDRESSSYSVNYYNVVIYCNALTIAEEGAQANSIYYSDSDRSVIYTSRTDDAQPSFYSDRNKTGYRLPGAGE